MNPDEMGFNVGSRTSLEFDRLDDFKKVRSKQHGHSFMTLDLSNFGLAGTTASHGNDEIPPEVKLERLRRTQELLADIVGISSYLSSDNPDNVIESLKLFNEMLSVSTTLRTDKERYDVREVLLPLYSQVRAANPLSQFMQFAYNHKEPDLQILALDFLSCYATGPRVPGLGLSSEFHPANMTFKKDLVQAGIADLISSLVSRPVLGAPLSAEQLATNIAVDKLAATTMDIDPGVSYDSPSDRQNIQNNSTHERDGTNNADGMMMDVMQTSSGTDRKTSALTSKQEEDAYIDINPIDSTPLQFAVVDALLSLITAIASDDNDARFFFLPVAPDIEKFLDPEYVPVPTIRLVIRAFAVLCGDSHSISPSSADAGDHQLLYPVLPNIADLLFTVDDEYVLSQACTCLLYLLPGLTIDQRLIERMVSILNDYESILVKQHIVSVFIAIYQNHDSGQTPLQQELLLVCASILLDLSSDNILRLMICQLLARISDHEAHLIDLLQTDVPYAGLKLQQYQEQLNTPGAPVSNFVLCENDERKPATLFCIVCEEHYCDSCFETLHLKSDKKDHTHKPLEQGHRPFAAILAHLLLSDPILRWKMVEVMRGLTKASYGELKHLTEQDLVTVFWLGLEALVESDGLPANITHLFSSTYKFDYVYHSMRALENILTCGFPVMKVTKRAHPFIEYFDLDSLNRLASVMHHLATEWSHELQNWRLVQSMESGIEGVDMTSHLSIYLYSLLDQVEKAHLDSKTQQAEDIVKLCAMIKSKFEALLAEADTSPSSSIGKEGKYSSSSMDTSSNDNNNSIDLQAIKEVEYADPSSLVTQLSLDDFPAGPSGPSNDEKRPDGDGGDDQKSGDTNLTVVEASICQQLAQQTSFTLEQLQDLVQLLREKGKKEQSDDTKNNNNPNDNNQDDNKEENDGLYVLGRAEFDDIMSSLDMEDPAVCFQLFSAFDTNKDGNVNFTELVSGLSIMFAGSPMDKIRLSFEAYDLNGDGHISRSELEDFLRVTLRLHDEPHDDAHISKKVQAIFARADKNYNQAIEFHEFRKAVLDDPTLFRTFWQHSLNSA